MKGPVSQVSIGGVIAVSIIFVLASSSADHDVRPAIQVLELSDVLQLCLHPVIKSEGAENGD